MNKINIDAYKQILQLGLAQIYYCNNILISSRTDNQIYLSISEQIRLPVHRTIQLGVRFKLLGI